MGFPGQVRDTSTYVLGPGLISTAPLQALPQFACWEVRDRYGPCHGFFTRPLGIWRPAPKEWDEELRDQGRRVSGALGLEAPYPQLEAFLAYPF